MSFLKNFHHLFVGLQHLRLEDNVTVFNALLECIAAAREWEKALHVFKHMNDIAVPANTATYNALLTACMNGTGLTSSFGHKLCVDT